MSDGPNTARNIIWPDDAVELYEEHAGEENVFHTGEERFSYIVDIYRDGGHSGVVNDDGKLTEEYSLDEDDDDGGKGSKAAAAGPFIRPKSATGDRTPRKYG